MVALDGLAILNGVLESEAARAVRALLDLLVREDSTPGEVANAYARAFGALARTSLELPGVADTWQAHLLVRLLEDDNPWSRQAERVGPEQISSSLRSRVRYELRILQSLFELTGSTIVSWTADRSSGQQEAPPGMWEPWSHLGDNQSGLGTLDSFSEVCQAVAGIPEWSELPNLLEPYWHRHGAGSLGRFSSLQWMGADIGLRGVAYPDLARLGDLFGYERQHRLLRQNTERFLAGLPAHDALLYGRPGTGKSSMVKALANEYATRGLRLLELPKEAFFELPMILRAIRHRGARYLLFIDDLSFEEDQAEYKALKVLLEGAVEARPLNVLVYATSNRLNLIREQFKDRGSRADDLHWRDTMDEKVALGERFGLRLTFEAPDARTYVAIAIGLARRRGIRLPEIEIEARAVRWADQHQNTRSGRLARQFVDDLEADLGDKSSR